MVETRRDAGSQPREAANEIKDTAANEAAKLKGVAGQHAGELAHQAKTEVRNVMSDARDEMQRQIDTQAHRLGGALQDAGGQLRSMAEGAHPGFVTDLAAQLGQTLDRVAATIDRGGAEAVADDLRSLARRQPGLFLLGAGLAGFVAARLLRAAGTRATGSQGTGGRTPEPVGRLPEPVTGAAPGAYGDGDPLGGGLQ
jgi:hypothetical protein